MATLGLQLSWQQTNFPKCELLHFFFWKEKKRVNPSGQIEHIKSYLGLHVCK